MARGKVIQRHNPPPPSPRRTGGRSLPSSLLSSSLLFSPPLSSPLLSSSLLFSPLLLSPLLFSPPLSSPVLSSSLLFSPLLLSPLLSSSLLFSSSPPSSPHPYRYLMDTRGTSTSSPWSSSHATTTSKCRTSEMSILATVVISSLILTPSRSRCLGKILL